MKPEEVVLGAWYLMLGASTCALVLGAEALVLGSWVIAMGAKLQGR